MLIKSLTFSLVLLAVIASIGGWGGEFVLDDRPFLVDNPQLSDTHPLSYFFSENLWHYSNIPNAWSANYRPLHFLVLWLFDRVGLAEPLALHLFSMVLHVLTTLLLLLAIRRLIPGVTPFAAFIGAGLFAVHPVHAEAVAWISAFIHPMTAVFLLAAWLTHEEAQVAGKKALAFIALIFFGLALLSNEIALAFPLFIVLNDLMWAERRTWQRIVPYFLVLAVYLMLRRLVLGETVPLAIGDPAAWQQLPLFLLEYLRYLVWPWPHPLYLQMPENWGISAGAVATVLLCTAMMFWLSRIPSVYSRAPLIALAWTVVFLLPLLAATFSPDARLALRSLYVPSAGLAMLAAWLVHTLPALQRPPGMIAVGLVLVLALVGSVAGSRLWRDDGIVYGRIVTWNPGHHAGYQGLGRYHERNGRIDEAISLYERAVEVAGPEERFSVFRVLAPVLGQSGENARSLELYEKLVSSDPGDASAWTGVGNNQWALGRPEAAAEAYLKAYEAEPGNALICHNLVLVLRQLGRDEEAMRYLHCAQQLR